MAATTSSSCSSFFNFRGNTSTGSVDVDPRVRNHGSSPPGCGKLDGVAMWIMNGFTTAFFASLERCSCIRIKTTEDDWDDDANHLPLIFNDGNGRRDSISTRRRPAGKGKQSRSSLLQGGE